MDWTCDNGIYKHFLIWKAQVEHLLQGPLHKLAEEQHVCYLWIWSGNEGNKLIERFKAEGPIISTGTDQNGNKLDTYWNCFQSALKNQTNALVAGVQVKRLFQGNMSLENFITKVTLLVDEAQYPAAMKERVIWDTLISGIFCEKTHDKIARKGGNITLKEGQRHCKDGIFHQTNYQFDEWDCESQCELLEIRQKPWQRQKKR